MNSEKMIAMMLTLGMLAASFAGCLGGDDEELEEYAPASGLDAEFVNSDWDPIIPNLNDGEMCDAIISAMTKTETREQVVDFTRGYYTSSQGVIGSPDAPAITSASDMNAAGTVVVLQSGTTSDIWANGDAENAANLPDATVNALNDWASVIEAVNNGDAHYAIGDAPVLALQGTLLVTFSDEVFGIAVREDSTQLLDALNVAIGAIVDSGEWDAIATAWALKAPLTDDTDANTASAYPVPEAGSTLTKVLNAGTLKFCSDTTYPPFENLDSNGVAEGFDIDIANALMDEMSAHYMSTSNPMFSKAGCTTSQASNYDSTATDDDGSCTFHHQIGLLNPLTGGLAAYAPGFTVAAGMAIDDLNAIDSKVQYSIVEQDTQSSADGGTAGATALVAAGVVGVAGAASSTVSMAANAVLSAAGVVQVSYASTSPALSDSTAYPHFWRVVSSDALQGPAMKTMVSTAGHTSPALVHMNNDYGTGLADSFELAWGSDNLCTKVSYDQASTDFSTQVSAVASASGCDSVVLIAYATDGADILETMAVAGVALPVFGADGIADAGFLTEFTAPGVTNGLQATKPGGVIVSAGDFSTRCAADDVCAGGIYTGETYDAVMMIGKAAAMEHGENMPTHLNMVGTDYAGSSGVHTFDANGDVGGSGYDICQFDALSASDVYFSCRSYWTSATDAVNAHPFAGQTIKIGFLNPITGGLSAYAAGFTAASQIALTALNVAGYAYNVQFEIVEVDSGSGEGTVAADGATTLSSSGVIAVVGAAGSSASMAANAVLSAAGIPMISYASTSPTLSDSTTYPHFYRVVPSDAIQGPALADVVADRGSTDPCLIAMDNAYGTDFAAAFRADWEATNGALTEDISYAADSTSLATQAQSIVDSGCDSVVAISYPADGAILLADLNTAGFTGAIYGGDGIAETGLCSGLSDISLCDGVVATKPADGTASDRSQAFALLCSQSPDCANGIYTAPTFDAFILIGFAVVASLTAPEGTTMSQLIAATGQGFVGASGTHTFNAHGDVGGNGYCIGDFTVTDGVADYTCTQHWDLNNGITSLTSS